MDRYRIGISILIVSASTLMALTLWKILKGNDLDDEVSQLDRLVSPRRSKDDDKRVQIKRRREYRLKSPKADDVYNDHSIFKRQNTM